MKRTIITKIILCVLLLIGMLPVSYLAAGESVTVQSVDFSVYEDGYGIEDQNYVTVTICFTAENDVTELSVLLLGEDIDELTPENKDKVIYMSQLATPADGRLEFPVQFSRVSSAAGKPDPIGTTLYLRVGGGKGTDCRLEVPFSLAQPAYGDVNGDGEVDVGDAVLVLRYSVQRTTLTQKQLRAADVLHDGKVDVKDAVRILQYEAGLEKEILKEV